MTFVVFDTGGRKYHVLYTSLIPTLDVLFVTTVHIFLKLVLNCEMAFGDDAALMSNNGGGGNKGGGGNDGGGEDGGGKDTA